MLMGQLHIHMQENEARTLPQCHIQKSCSKVIKYPNVIAKNTYHLEENKGINLHDLELSNNLLGITPKKKQQKKTDKFHINVF